MNESSFIRMEAHCAQEIWFFLPRFFFFCYFVFIITIFICSVYLCVIGKVGVKLQRCVWNSRSCVQLKFSVRAIYNNKKIRMATDSRAHCDALILILIFRWWDDNLNSSLSTVSQLLTMSSIYLYFSCHAACIQKENNRSSQKNLNAR